MTNSRLTAVLALLVVVFFAALWSLRGPRGRIRGDEGTYLAMAESLARDGDLWFGERDRARTEADGRPGRQALILQRVEPRVAYSKPLPYPVLAAPFFLVLGEIGLVVVNALALGLALFVLARYLRRLAPGAGVMPTVVAFAGLSLLPAYLPWRTSDALQASLTLIGLALCLWDLRSSADSVPDPATDRRQRTRIILGGVLLAVVVLLRVSNGLVAVIPVVALGLAGRRRQALWAAIAIGVALVAGLGANMLLAGNPSPYTAVRATFTPETGYPSAEDFVGPRSPFDSDRASYDRTKTLIEAPLASLYGGLYFLVGRHTGVLVYFPLAVFLVAAAVRRPDRGTWVVLAAVAALSFFYLVFLPFNYFGGATCVGNRYFLVSYAALPFALRRPLGAKSLAAAWALALLIAGSALASVTAVGDRDRSTQSHAYAGVFRWLPYESTAASIDGGRDVFWFKELGRFVDPWPAVSRWSFRLSTADPPAQIQVANRRREDRLRFLVLSAAPRIELIYRDWGRTVKVPLERPVGERGLVEIEPSRPLRVHPLWFRNVWDHGLPYYVRDFRLAVRTPDGEPATAEIRHLGTLAWPREVFSRRVEALELPARAVVGTVDRIPLVVLNTSPTAWSGGGPFAVQLSYRLEALDGSGEAVEGPRTALAAVASGRRLERELEISWPQRPGSYRLTVDLLIEGVAWFGGRVGEPLGETLVEVEARDKSAALGRVEEKAGVGAGSGSGAADGR